MTSSPLFQRIAIVNRGEAAMRLINAARELKDPASGFPLTVALHTAAEASAMFVREADEAVELSTGEGNRYIDYEALEEALVRSRADAAWVGWGFVAEHPEFADLCERLGITFVGPPGDVMRQLGDKIGAKKLAESSGVPVATWSSGPVTSVAHARELAPEIGLPLMIKAAAGGGGRGIRRVEAMGELATAFERATAEAEKAFGDGTVFMEPVITNARHVEVQIAADNFGEVWALGVRDCSLQRRNQKVIEESSSPALTPQQEEDVRSAAISLCKAAGYRNLGTVEFLYQPESGEFAFLEVNTRLQVEHPVTEETTRFDLVKLQLRIAAGWSLAGESPGVYGHAIEARLNAEDPARGFAPAPGRISLLEFPTGPGVRVDTGVAEGDVIPADYDSMIAKIIAWAPTRPEALDRLTRALEQTRVVIAGGSSNKSFLLDTLARPEVRDGVFTTAWLDALTESGAHLSTGEPAIALVAAAIDAYEADAALGQSAFYASALRGRPQLSETSDGRFAGRINGESYQIDVAQVAPDTFSVTLEDVSILARVKDAGRSGRTMTVGANRFRILSSVDGVDHLVEVDGVAHRVSRDDGGTVRAPAPALVVAVSVNEGDVISRGASLVVLESMKVETAIQAPFDATVIEVVAKANTQVDVGSPLIRLEPVVAEAQAAAPASEPVSFTNLAATVEAEDSPVNMALNALETLRWKVLGFEGSTTDLNAALANYRAARVNVNNDGAVSKTELSILDAISDITMLSRNRSSRVDEVTLVQHNPQEFFHRYLRSLDVDAEGLPQDFADRLLGAFGHYGLDTLDWSPELAECAWLVFRSQQDQATLITIALAILQAMPSTALEATDPQAAGTSDHRAVVRATLNRVIAATQVRSPAVADAARRLRFRLFDKPFIAAARVAESANIRHHLSYLQHHPQAADRSDHIRDMVASPERLIGFFDDSLDAEDPDHTALLEVITRRNYQTKSLERFRIGRSGERLILTVSYEDQGQRSHVLVTTAERSALRGTVDALADIATKAPQTDDVAIDLYLRSMTVIDDDALAAEFILELRQASWPGGVQRVTLSAVDSDGRVHHVTVRPDADGVFLEDKKIRGLHPTIADRLHLWRFRDFNVDRLASHQDTYLFSATGIDDPDDRRLFSAAEVRDLTPVRDSDGRIVALPELEARLMACLNDIRRTRESGRPEGSAQWNRVLLYVWPRVEIPLQDFEAIARTVAPATAGLGLEDVRVQAKLVGADGRVSEVVVRIADTPETGLVLSVIDAPKTVLQPLDRYAQTLQRARRRQSPYPYELMDQIAGEGGSFIEYDLDIDGTFAPVDRPPGANTAGIVVGLVDTPTARYPEGMRRVALFGDPTKSLGSISEAECRRILAGIDLAEMLDVPVEWFALSSGARIAMDSGTENMDWISRVLRRIVEVTQAGREINIIVTGINVGAQPYWNAEATMVMHTRGILIMTPESAMVLTGKEALDYSGGVSAEDNFGIGGHDRIMGPNGQAQYWAKDLRGAIDILFRHYEFGYVAPGERFPRSRRTTDPVNRDVRSASHDVEGIDLKTVGDIFSDEANPGRKKPFDIRTVMNAVVDADHAPLERWSQMRDAENVVIYDAFLGGFASTVIGIESRPLQRYGMLPADGPDQWTAGTLFPLASKKAARGINAASGSRPVVVLANLSGFDGSPESLARLQLEYGAEIGRAVVNFDGPIVFCVISRYHGGAFVVFSGTLHDNMQVLAVEGTKASVLGGAPAAAVVFTREVRARVQADPRIVDKRAELAAADEATMVQVTRELRDLEDQVHAEKLGLVADEFDGIHSIERAQQVGSIDRIVAPQDLREQLVTAVLNGMETTLNETTAAATAVPTHVLAEDVEMPPLESSAAPVEAVVPETVDAVVAEAVVPEAVDAAVPEAVVPGSVVREAAPDTVVPETVSADEAVPEMVAPEPAPETVSPEVAAVPEVTVVPEVTAVAEVTAVPELTVPDAGISKPATRKPSIWDTAIEDPSPPSGSGEPTQQMKAVSAVPPAEAPNGSPKAANTTHAAAVGTGAVIDDQVPVEIVSTSEVAEANVVDLTGDDPLVSIRPATPTPVTEVRSTATSTPNAAISAEPAGLLDDGFPAPVVIEDDDDAAGQDTVAASAISGAPESPSLDFLKSDPLADETEDDDYALPNWMAKKDPAKDPFDF